MKKRPPGSVITIVLTLITVLFWAGYVTYQAVREPASYDVDPAIIKPFSPSLDTETLNLIPSRIYFEESQLPETVIVENLPEEEVEEEVATTSASPTPTATPQPEIEEETESTGSGTL